MPSIQVDTVGIEVLCANDKIHNACYVGLDAVKSAFLEEDNLPHLEAKSATEHGRGYLHQACLGGHKDVVVLLLDQGADLASRDDTDGTPLHVACYHGFYDCARALLERGADANAIDKYGETPLHEACSQGRGDIVKLLIEFGADVLVKDKDGDTPLHRACDAGDLDLVFDLCIRNPDSMDIENEDGNTPLHTAVEGGHTDIALELCSRGANALQENGDNEDCFAIIHRQLENVDEDYYGEDSMNFHKELMKINTKCQKWERRKNFIMTLSSCGLLDDINYINNKLMKTELDKKENEKEDYKPSMGEMILSTFGREIAAFL
jgi:ankyrin repeat protein